MSSRRSEDRLTALSAALADGGFELRSPRVGWLRDAPLPGQLVTGGQRIGTLEVLGRLYRVDAPAGTHGVVSGEQRFTRPAKLALDYAAPICQLAPMSSGQTVAARSASETGEAGEAGAASLVFRAPTSGRFYVRSSPDAPAFVNVGSSIEAGAAVCLLEVMKTFNHILFSGDGLPARAKVLRVIPSDGDDVELGDPLIELQPLP